MKVLVFGASPKTERYSNRATRMLIDYGHEVEAIGLRANEIYGIEIQTGQPPLKDIDVITLYVGSVRQEKDIDYLISLSPKAIIFNPGTENPIFELKAKEAGIKTLRACTLVMLSTGSFKFDLIEG